jgi:hypothetical protein
MGAYLELSHFLESFNLKIVFGVDPLDYHPPTLNGHGLDSTITLC